MKTIMEFNLPEDREEFDDATKGSQYKGEIEGFANYLRGIVKYDNYSDFPISSIEEQTIQMVVEILRTKLYEYCEDSLS